MRMALYPVPRDIDTATDPHLFVALHIVKKTLQGRESPWPADKSAMQADRHHFGRAFTFSVKHIERVFEVGVKMVAGVKPLWRSETHIVAIERIGHDQVRLARAVGCLDGCPERQIIAVV